jgi:hypothetical protein
MKTTITAPRRFSSAESYSSGRGRFQGTYDQLSSRIPAEGACEDAMGRNRHLDRLRRAGNAYRDLFHNGLANRKGDFRALFGFVPTFGRDGSLKATAALFRQIEPKMDAFINAAAVEQGMLIAGADEQRASLGVSLRSRIDGLSTPTKVWLHSLAQQLNDSDADGYVDNVAARRECVAAGVVTQLSRKRVELSAEANDLLYSQQYLAKVR